MTFRASILNMSIRGNISNVGNTLRIEVTCNGAVVIPIDDYKIINASKLSSSWIWAQFATYHTTHNRGNYAVCKICYNSKDNDGTALVKNQSDYEVAYGSERSTSNFIDQIWQIILCTYSSRRRRGKSRVL